MSANKPGYLLNAGLLPAGKRPYLYWRLTYLLALGLFVAGGIITVYFVRQNIYNAIANSYAVVALSSSLSADAIDAAAFEKSQQLITAKESIPAIPDNPKNMFEYTLTSSTPSTTPAIKNE